MVKNCMGAKTAASWEVLREAAVIGMVEVWVVTVGVVVVVLTYCASDSINYRIIAVCSIIRY